MSCEIGLVAIGSNLPGEAGNSLETCIRALVEIESPEVRVVRRARWRRCPAFPAGSGPDFVNGAALVKTTLSAAELLSRLHSVEAKLGRIRRLRWGPRVCDLDLIAYGNVMLPDLSTLRRMMVDGATTTAAPDRMILPHPRMHERAFVLAPLADIAPDWQHPLTGKTVTQMLSALPARAREEVTVIDEDNP